MYFLGSERNPPHINAIYGEDTAAFDINSGEEFDGSLPLRAAGMVREWIEIHQIELLVMWKPQEFKKIDPLIQRRQTMKFHKVKEVSALADLKLSVQFTNGTTKIYDVAPLMRRFSAFKLLKDESLFRSVEVDQGGYGIIWNDDLDLSCDELWENGAEVATPFDGLISFSDASELWGLSESTLRKAVAYGKIVPGVDARKYGKQWIINRDAMLREYGNPVC